jgi:hypothetical protein
LPSTWPRRPGSSTTARRAGSDRGPLRIIEWTTALAAVAGLVAVSLYNFRQLRIQQEAIDRQHETSVAQVNLINRGQITDRFSRAIDQLGQEGSDNIGLRLGGIYALERIMKDSSDDEPAVIEVLCLFVRIHAPARDSSSSPSAAPAQGDRKSASSPDVQAAVVVLARRPNPKDGRNQRVDFSDALLLMPGAVLTKAHLAGTWLVSANLTSAALHEAHLPGTNLSEANLSEANLTKAYLPGAKLVRAGLSNAILNEADLTVAELAQANLVGAYLGNASLVNADLTEADLTGANLANADLRGANLSGARGLTCAQLSSALLDDMTRLPSGVAPTRCRAGTG